MNLASDMFAPIHKHQRDTMFLEHCLITDSKIIGTYALKYIYIYMHQEHEYQGKS